MENTRISRNKHIHHRDSYHQLKSWRRGRSLQATECMVISCLWLLGFGTGPSETLVACSRMNGYSITVEQACFLSTRQPRCIAPVFHSPGGGSNPAAEGALCLDVRVLCTYFLIHTYRSTYIYRMAEHVHTKDIRYIKIYQKSK